MEVIELTRLKMRTYQKKCAYCKLPFIARRRDKIYCKSICKRLAFEERNELMKSIDKHKLKE